MSADQSKHEIESAWRRYLVVLSGLLVVFLTSTIALWPWPYTLAVEYFELPRFERQFGFRGARLQLPGEATSSIYGIVEVVPGGILALSGVRPGDVPIAHHGGLWSFHGALQDSRSGREAEFTVIALAEWRDASQKRRIMLPALKAASSSAAAAGPTTR